MSCPSRLPGISSIPLLWQPPPLAHSQCWPQISNSWSKADHCWLHPWVYTWAVGSILIQIVSVPFRNKTGEHNTSAAKLSVLISATHHWLWLEAFKPCSHGQALKRLCWDVKWGHWCRTPEKSDTDAHLGKNCTGVSGSKKPTLKRRLQSPIKDITEHYCYWKSVIHWLLRTREWPLHTGTSANSQAYTTLKYDLLRAKWNKIVLINHWTMLVVMTE